MQYRFEVGPWGAECVAGVIPDNIWKYIQDECDGSATTYLEKLSKGEVPEKFKLAESIGKFNEPADCVEKIIYSNSGAYYDTDIVVYDEDDDEVYRECLDDVSANEYKENIIKQPKGTHFFIWRSVEKSCWLEGEFEDEEFDESKFGISVDTIMNGGDILVGLIKSISYDDEVFETTGSDSRGVSYELNFYEAEDED